MRTENAVPTKPETERSDRYHVVCHDCTCEKLTADPATAERIAATHETATGHRVEVGALSSG
jgi:hypothetical protein